MASVARNTITRSVRPITSRGTTSRAITRPILNSLLLRFNSSKASPPSTEPPRTPEQVRWKEALERQDNLQRDWDAKVITYEELLPYTENPTSDTFLIDVREPEEVMQGMIPSAVNVPLTVLADSLHMPSEFFKKKHGFEKPRKDQQLIFYCRSGMRSTSASDVAKRNGFTNILNYKGSWLEWTEKQILPKPS